MPQAFGDGFDRSNGIDQEGRVGRILLRPGGAVGIPGEEDVRDLLQVTQLGPAVIRIEEVDGDVLHARGIVGRPAGESDDVPVVERVEMADQVAADDSRCADHHGGLAFVQVGLILSLGRGGSVSRWLQVLQNVLDSFPVVSAVTVS